MAPKRVIHTFPGTPSKGHMNLDKLILAKNQLDPIHQKGNNNRPEISIVVCDFQLSVK